MEKVAFKCGGEGIDEKVTFSLRGKDTRVTQKHKWQVLNFLCMKHVMEVLVGNVLRGFMQAVQQ